MEKASQWLRSAKSLAVLTGAGISAESGIPTFRGAAGLWRNFRPEELATPEAFARNPILVWEWYEWRRELIAAAEPNPGHLALVELERRIPRFTLITQNVDGLHDRAGSRKILKLHGDIWTDRCTVCGSEVVRQPGEKASTQPPRCECGGIRRPGVVWFGEPLPADVWRKAEEAVQNADVMLVIGTSAVVYPAAGLAPLAVSRGAKVVEVNLEKTPFSSMVDCSIQGKAGEILPKLL
ncbi:MAG: NAD-dependent deacylase [Bryobacteraceae bacterium]|nr:NAD-dependent deacylase [Bryobacteraceae bacterium]